MTHTRRTRWNQWLRVVVPILVGLAALGQIAQTVLSWTAHM
jgi:hypothetical protein